MSDPLPSMVIEFDPPLEWNGTNYDAIELREPKASEVVKAEAERAQGIKYGVMLVSIVSGKPRQVIEQMPISKLVRGIEYLTSFLSAGQPTGES